MNNLDKNQKYMDHLFDVVEKLDLADRVTMKLSRNQFVSKAHNPESNIYLLVEGVIITSLVGTDGFRINLSYMNKPGIVTLLRDEEERVVEQPYDIEVDSDKAKLYKVNRVKFWELVNHDEMLNRYVKIYYREKISENVQKFIRHVGSNRIGQVKIFLYECAQIFGVKDQKTGYILINHKITHQTIADFCGIKNRSSITRIMGELIKNDVIGKHSGLILVKDMAYLEKYTKSI